MTSKNETSTRLAQIDATFRRIHDKLNGAEQLHGDKSELVETLIEELQEAWVREEQIYTEIGRPLPRNHIADHRLHAGVLDVYRYVLEGEDPDRMLNLIRVKVDRHSAEFDCKIAAAQA